MWTFPLTTKKREVKIGADNVGRKKARVLMRTSRKRTKGDTKGVHQKKTKPARLLSGRKSGRKDGTGEEKSRWSEKKRPKGQRKRGKRKRRRGGVWVAKA